MATVLDTPLVVDLDGTLTPTDTLVESLVIVVKRSPINLLRIPLWLLQGRAGFKDIVAAHASISGELLPYRESLLDYLREEKQKGRKIVLATAAHHSIAQNVANHLGLFDQILATEAGNNLKGEAKLRAIKEHVGDTFVYAGDSQADVPIWRAAHAAVLVDVSKRTAQSIGRDVQIERQFSGERAGLAVWLRAMRVHQWLKNLLLFVPLLTAFSFFDLSKLTSITMAFFAFSFAASATYVVNDLWDLENDRAHPRKRNRAFASARLSILHGLVMAAGALSLAVILALSVSKAFFVMLLLYLVLTSAYSWFLKERILVDVLVLSLLYTLRIIAGSVAVGISTSTWLLAFSVFIFLSLALVKRCAELVLVESSGRTGTRGRDYRLTDLVVLWPLGVGSALSAVVVFGLFISAPETQTKYGTPQLLWLVALGLIHWIARLWVKTSRGEMHDDPVTYAVKNHYSRLTLLFMVVVVLAAHFLTLGTLI